MLRQGLSAPGMYAIVREKLLEISDSRMMRSSTIPIVDDGLAAAAMFALKSPSMLQFVNSVDEPAVAHNLKQLFKIDTIPSDTAMREIVDPIKTGQRPESGRN